MPTLEDVTSQTHDGPACSRPASGELASGGPAADGPIASGQASDGQASGGRVASELASGGPAAVRPADDGLALDGLAVSTAGLARYLPLRGQPVHQRAGEWVVTRPDDVDAVLASGAMTVAPVGEPAGAARQLQARMARFSDGAVHARRRTLAEALVPAAAVAERAAWTMTAQTMTGWRGRPDAMDLAWRVPVAVLASALGVPSAAVDQVVGLTGQLCDTLAPRTGAGPPPGPAGPAADGDAAATALLAALAAAAAVATPAEATPAEATPGMVATTSEPATPPDRTSSSALEASSAPVACAAPAVGPAQPAPATAGERAVAAASILFQARDATAGLIGLALTIAAGHPLATAADLVDRALRDDPPVQCTRRTATAPATIGEVTIPAGAAVRVLLATADRGRPWTPATFGRGPHGCPGRLLATALARGVVGAILGAGWRPVPGPDPGYEPRPNLRIPVSVPIERPCQPSGHANRATTPTERPRQRMERP